MEPDTNLNAGNGMGTGGTSQGETPKINEVKDTSTFFNVAGKAETSTPVVQAVPEKAPEEVKPKAIPLEPTTSAAPEPVTAEVQVKTPAQLSSAFAATDLSLTELTSPPENQPMSHLKIALIVGGVLLVLGGVAAAIYFSSSSNLKGDITAAPQTCATDTYAPKAGTSATTATGNNFGADLTALRAPAISQPNYTNVYYPAPAPISNQGASAIANNSPVIANNPAANQVSNAGAPVVNNNPAAAVSNQIPSLREAPAANSSVLNNVAPVDNNAVGGSPSATIVGSPAMTVGGTPAATVGKTPVLSVGGTPPSSAAVGSPITVGGSTSSATTANPTTATNPTTGGSSTSTTTPSAPVCSRITPTDCALVSELYTNQSNYILNTQTISHLKTWNDVCTARTSSTTPTTNPATGGTTTTSSTTTTTSSTTPNTNLTTGGGTTSTTVGVTPPTTTTGGSTLTTGGTVSTSTSNTRTTTTTTGSTLPTASTGLITTTTGSTTTTTGGTGLTTTTPTTINSCQQQDKDIQDAYRNQQWQAVLDLTNVKIDSTICRIASGTDRTKEKLLFALISSTNQKMTSLRPALSREIADLRTTLVRDGNIIPPTSSTACTDSQRNPQPITTSLETVLGNPDQVTTSSGSSATTGSLPNIDLTTVSDGQLMGGFAICSQTTKTAISPATTEAPKQTDAPPATQPTTTGTPIIEPIAQNQPTATKTTTPTDYVPYSGSGSLPQQNPPADQNLDLGLGSSGSSGSVSAPVPPAGSEAPAAPVSPLQSESIATTGFTSSASAPVPSNVINPPKLATVTPTNTIVPANTSTPKATAPVLHGAAPTEKPVPPELTKTGPEDFYYLLMMLPIALFFKWRLGKAK